MITLGSTTAAAAEAGVHETILGSGMTTLIISNEELDDILKIVKAFGDSGLFIKIFSEKNGNKA